MDLPFPNVFYGPFSTWICKISTMDLGNFPFGILGYECRLCILLICWNHEQEIVLNWKRSYNTMCMVDFKSYSCLFCHFDMEPWKVSISVNSIHHTITVRHFKWFSNKFTETFGLINVIPTPKGLKQIMFNCVRKRSILTQVKVTFHIIQCFPQLLAKQEAHACLCISNVPHYKILKLMAKLLGHVNLIGRSELYLNSMSCQKPWSDKNTEKQHPQWLTFANFRTTAGPRLC